MQYIVTKTVRDNDVKTTGATTIKRPHFLIKVENDSVPKSFSTNETIKKK